MAFGFIICELLRYSREIGARNRQTFLIVSWNLTEILRIWSRLTCETFCITQSTIRKLDWININRDIKFLEPNNLKTNSLFQEYASCAKNRITKLKSLAFDFLWFYFPIFKRIHTTNEKSIFYIILLPYLVVHIISHRCLCNNQFLSKSVMQFSMGCFRISLHPYM